jgi:hypothetical protein
MEKDRHAQTRQMEELTSQLDSEAKAKSNLEKLAKQMEMQVTEMQVGNSYTLFKQIVCMIVKS